MLDIISMIILSIFLLITLLMYLVIVGGKINKTKEEQYYEDMEEMNYFKEYKEKKRKTNSL